VSSRCVGKKGAIVTEGKLYKSNIAAMAKNNEGAFLA